MATVNNPNSMKAWFEVIILFSEIIDNLDDRRSPPELTKY